MSPAMAVAITLGGLAVSWRISRRVVRRFGEQISTFVHQTVARASSVIAVVARTIVREPNPGFPIAFARSLFVPYATMIWYARSRDPNLAESSSLLELLGYVVSASTAMFVLVRGLPVVDSSRGETSERRSEPRG